SDRRGNWPRWRVGPQSTRTVADHAVPVGDRAYIVDVGIGGLTSNVGYLHHDGERGQVGRTDALFELQAGPHRHQRVDGRLRQDDRIPGQSQLLLAVPIVTGGVTVVVAVPTLRPGSPVALPIRSDGTPLMIGWLTGGVASILAVVLRAPMRCAGKVRGPESAAAELA